MKKLRKVILVITRQVNQTRLALWSELIGTYKGYVIDDQCIHVRIDDNVVSFVIGSEEESSLQQILSDNMLGRKIGILKTDLIDRPLLIRLIDS